MSRIFYNHPIIAGIIIGITTFMLFIGIVVFFEFAEVGFKPFHYEYIDSSGEWKEATYCSIPYRAQVRCEVDGETVMDVKRFRKVADE